MTHRWCSLQEESQTSVHTSRTPTTPPARSLPGQPPQAPRSSKDRAHTHTPPPLPVYLPQAGSSAGHQGPRNIWAPSVKPHPCSPKLLRPWFPVFPVAATLILRSRAPGFSASPFLVWVLKAWHSPGGSISLCSCSLHLYIWAINLWQYYTLCTSVTFFLCKFGMCNQLHSGQMGVGWGKMETGARKREALLLDWYLWDWELRWGRLGGNSQNKVTGVGAVMSWRSHCDTYPHTRRGARIGQEGIEGNKRHLPSYQNRNS